jgi:hypothetical protein
MQVTVYVVSFRSSSGGVGGFRTFDTKAEADACARGYRVRGYRTSVKRQVRP